MNKEQITEIILDKVDKLLLEARIDNIKKKFPNDVHGFIDEISVDYDPSNNDKYLDWLSKILLYPIVDIPNDYLIRNDDGTYKINSTGSGRWGYNTYLSYQMNAQDRKILKDDIDYFHNYIRKFEQRDINQYASWDELHKAVEKAKLKLSRKEIKESGVIKLFENEDFLILTPLTHQAACRYGSNTRWCVAMRGYSGYFENYFTQGPIFFLMDKRMIPPTKSMKTEDYYKLAMHYRPRFDVAPERNYQRYQMLNNSKKAFQLASKLNKEEFMQGADLNHAKIDFWTVSDRQVKKSVAQKYMGGPGRGQGVRGQEAMVKFENVMEKYTKKVLSDFYDSIDKDAGKKLEELKNTIQKINDNLNVVRDKIDELDNLWSIIGDVNVDWDDMKSRISEIPDKLSVEEFKTSVEGHREKLMQIKDELEVKRETNSEKLEDMEVKTQNFQFYDPEKSIPQNN